MPSKADQLTRLAAVEAARLLTQGAMSAEEYVGACVERILTDEGRVQAWAWFDAEFALAQARELDGRRAAGEAVGPLHGLPVGIKDIIDLRGLPTEDGTPLHAGRIADRDATVVARLRAAGAVLMGKTVTTELATYAPGKTRNPHNPAHTPGGSSSGSAAAVAAGMVPLAVGTQTNGSVIRPAAYCGVVGFKPSYGLIPCDGILTQSPPLDQVGVFARSVEDAALIARVLAGDGSRDAVWPTLPSAPALAYARTPLWQEVWADARAAFETLAEQVGAPPVELPAQACSALDWHRIIMEADIAASFEREYETGRDQLSASLRQQVERGRQVLAVDYRRALAQVPILNAAFAPLFDEFDALLTPATQGTAPAGLSSTGSPMFCTLWTLCGMPAVTLPLLSGANGLPLGVQLVGRRGDDARLLRTARWLSEVASRDG